jgi:TM2 domain-containing membrane protein YozV
MGADNKGFRYQQPTQYVVSVPAIDHSTSPKSGIAALVLAIFLGIFGAHRFYVGKVGTALLMLITVGGAGIWWIIDIITIILGSFTDKGRRFVKLSK